MNTDPGGWARLARALRESRRDKGLTQAALAERAHVSTFAVVAAERGEPPKKRMPPTLPKIARALGWPPRAIEAILEGGDPPEGWGRPAVLDAEMLESVMTKAMVTATNHVTAAEMREAIGIAMDELRRLGVFSQTDGVQPNKTM